jgi:TonB family protein
VTDGERIAAAAVLSVALHWALLAGWRPEPPVPPPGEDVLLLDLSGPDTGISLAAPIILEQALPAAPQDTAADRRRDALVRYLDRVSESVHAHRRTAGEGRRLIGNALFRIVIDGDGRFVAVAMLRGSGDARLDADAEAAVRAASGTVRRPRLLGDGALAITLAVKYQSGL